jgi:hypothetical protein
MSNYYQGSIETFDPDYGPDDESSRKRLGMNPERINPAEAMKKPGPRYRHLDVRSESFPNTKDRIAITSMYNVRIPPAFP